jgi:hypothetical protein
MIVRELLGLFVDDGSLAFAIVVVVLVAAMLASVDAPSLVTGGVLFFGCILVLVENLARSTRRFRTTARDTRGQP